MGRDGFQGEVVHDAGPGAPPNSAARDRFHFRQLRDRVCKGRSISWLDDELAIAHDLGRVTNVGHDAWHACRHGLANHRSHPEAHLVLVGKEQFPEDDAAAGWLAREWSRLPPAPRRHVRVGVRSDVGRYLQASDLSVFPSRREGFGTVIIEAMACGLPCIVAELPGITDYIFDGDGSDGLVIAQDDQAALARAMQALLADQYIACYRALTARRRTQSPKPF